MELQDEGTHVGVVMGKILLTEHTLVYSLHRDGKGCCTTRISQRSRYQDTKEEAAHLGRCLGDLVYGIWRNDSIPPWYFIQLEEGFDYKVLHPFNVPITARLTDWSLVQPE